MLLLAVTRAVDQVSVARWDVEWVARRRGRGGDLEQGEIVRAKVRLGELR
jgi:hypothetical protein